MSNVRYRIVKGDTLWTIARRFKTTVDELARLNNIGDIHNIKVFQTLKIPNARSAFGDTPRRHFHRVRAGESLASIAQSYNISVQTLAQANGLQTDQPAPFDRKLRIPATAPPTVAHEPPSQPIPPCDTVLREIGVEALLLRGC